MKSVILAGGYGTRMNEETKNKPKPMIKIGEKPILWHIMKTYSVYGIKDFVICCGYKGEEIKKYFLDSFDIQNIHKNQNHVEMTVNTESQLWNITLVDTGLDTMTGGRLKRVEKYVGNDTFHFTYGDTLNDVNIENLLKFHKKNKSVCTVTACRPQEKYGVLIIENNRIIEFKEKPVSKNWVNGGYFVLEPSVFDLIHNDKTIWEKQPLETLVRKNQFYAFKHNGFYQPMDTISEKNRLNDLWKLNEAPWKVL